MNPAQDIESPEQQRVAFEKNIESLLRVSRRGFTEKAAAFLAGIASQPIIAAQQCLFHPLNETTKDFKYISKGRFFVSTAEKAVTIFWRSVAQEQTAIYQLPFRHDVVLGNHLMYLNTVEQLVSGFLHEERKKPKEERDRLHRLVAYSAIVAAHLIPYAKDSEEAERLQRVLEVTYAGAVNQTFGSDVTHNDIRDIVAQNCTASLISSRESWQRFTISNSLIDLMRAVIAAFLSGDEGERHLHAAAAAYQFLLSYQNALGERGSTLQSSLIDAIRRDVNEHRSPLSTWLRALDRQYAALSGFELQMPQLTELVMGRNLFPEDDPRHEATKLFTAMRLYMNAMRFIRSGRRADYESNVERKALIASKVFLAENGVDETLWRTTIRPYITHAQINITTDYINAIKAMFRDTTYGIPEHASFPSKTLWHQLRAPIHQFSEPNIAVALLGGSLVNTPPEALWSAFGSLARAQKTTGENVTRVHELTLRSSRRKITGRMATYLQKVSRRSFDEWFEVYNSEPANRQTMQVVETAMKEALGATHVAPRGARARSDVQEQSMKEVKSSPKVSREALREFYEQCVAGTSNRSQFEESRGYVAKRQSLLKRLDLAKYAKEGHRFVAINLETEDCLPGKDARSVETEFVRIFGPEYGKLHIEQIAR